MDLQQRLRSSLLERPVWHDGRAGEPGFPSLFIGSGVATRMLVEIAVGEPLRLGELPITQERDFFNMQGVLRKLVGQGLVRRYKDPRANYGYLLTLNREHAGFEHIRALLRAVAAENRLLMREPLGAIDNLATITEPITYESCGPVARTKRDHRLPFGNLGQPVLTLFGHPNRTKAILFAGSIGSIDQSTVGRIVGIGPLKPAAQLMQGLECDNILQCELSGNFNMYSLVDSPWTPSLRKLIKDVVARDDYLTGLVNAARVMTAVGQDRRRSRKPSVLRDRRVLLRACV